MSLYICIYLMEMNKYTSMRKIPDNVWNNNIGEICLQNILKLISHEEDIWFYQQYPYGDSACHYHQRAVSSALVQQVINLNKAETYSTDYLLAFSKCFHAGFWAFQHSNRVQGGTNSFNLWAILKWNTYLIFISGFLVYSVGHYWLMDF